MKAEHVLALVGLGVFGLVGAAHAADKRRSQAEASQGQREPQKLPTPGSEPTVTPVSYGEGSDVVLSFMALRELPPGLDARLVEVPGRVSPGHKHPGWDWLGRLRSPDGQVLSNLLAELGLSDAGRIAAFGFSAGSNAGLREILTDWRDRARLDFVACLDGLHAAVGADGAFLDATAQIDPFRDAAIEAATGELTLIATASSIAAPRVPGVTLTRTREAWNRIADEIEDLYGQIAPPAEPPAAVRSAVVRPDAVRGWGDFLFLAYPPSGDPGQDHRDQAQIVAPLIAETMLAPLWHNEPGGMLT